MSGILGSSLWNSARLEASVPTLSLVSSAEPAASPAGFLTPSVAADDSTSVPAAGAVGAAAAAAVAVDAAAAAVAVGAAAAAVAVGAAAAAAVAVGAAAAASLLTPGLALLVNLRFFVQLLSPRPGPAHPR